MARTHQTLLEADRRSRSAKRRPQSGHTRIHIAGVALLALCSILPGCSCNNQNSSATSPSQGSSQAAENQTAASQSQSQSRSEASSGSTSPANQTKGSSAKQAGGAGSEPSNAGAPTGGGAPQTSNAAGQAGADQRSTLGALLGGLFGDAPEAEKSVKPTTAGEAREFAEARQREARESANKGDYEQAFRQSLAGWQALQGFQSDGRCKDLAGALLNEMERYGETMSKDPPDESSLDRKRLVIE